MLVGPPSFRKRLRPVLVPVIGICLVGYFLYHSIQGERGWLARQRLEHEVAEAEQTLAQLQAQHAYLEHRAELMDPRHIDGDMLDEQLRQMLNYAGPNDAVMYFQDGR